MNETELSEAVDVSEAPEHRQQQLYFRELFQLKVRCEYTRRYRNILSAWVTRIAVLRAVASSGSIAGWVIWRDYAFVWGAIIAVSQLADALKDAIPYTARQKATNALLTDLDALFIEALFEWEGVFSGKFTNEEITERRRRLMQLEHELEGKHFPTGDLPNRPDLLALAEQDTIAYLETMFREERPRNEQDERRCPAPLQHRREDAPWRGYPALRYLRGSWPAGRANWVSGRFHDR